MEDNTLKQMIGKFFDVGEKYRKQPSMARVSKHMRQNGVKATKAYADGRQKSAKKQRNMRKRK